MFLIWEEVLAKVITELATNGQLPLQIINALSAAAAQ
jgi:hypothetical protein